MFFKLVIVPAIITSIYINYIYSGKWTYVDSKILGKIIIYNLNNTNTRYASLKQYKHTLCFP